MVDISIGHKPRHTQYVLVNKTTTDSENGSNPLIIQGQSSYQILIHSKW